MTTDITELTPESARESGNILIIVAARMARREFFTPLHALCESGKRVVSTRALCDAVERAEEHMVSQVSKIVDGHDRLTKKLKEAESRNAELVEALEKAQRANGYLREQSAEWERKAISNFEDCAEMSARVEELESQRKLAFTASNRWADKFREAEKRIAELEFRSVTVKLPQRLQPGADGWDDWYVHSDDEGEYLKFDDVLAMLTAAGIKVEAE